MLDCSTGSFFNLVVEGNRNKKHRHLYGWGSLHYEFKKKFNRMDSFPGIPTAFSSFDGKFIVQACVGDMHAAFLTKNGEVYTFGIYKAGEEYHGFKPDRDPEEFQEEPELMVLPDPCIQICCSGNRTIAVTQAGDVYEWGFTKTQQNENTRVSRHARDTLNPSVVMIPDKVNVVYGSSGQHMFAVGSDGTVYAWGNNECFQLGINNKPLPEDEDKSSKSKGEEDKSKGKAKGKKGDEKSEDKSKGKGKKADDKKKGASSKEEAPKEEGEKKKRPRKRVKKEVVARPTEAKVINEMKEKIKKLCGGEGHSVLLTEEGEAYSWGRNNHGQLGLGTTEAIVEEPRKIEMEDIEDISCGLNHTFLVNKEGEVYAFGALKSAGIPSENDNESRPVRICGKLKKNKVISVACGREHSLLIAEVEK